MTDAEIAASSIALELPKMRVSYEEGTLSEGELAATWHEQLQPGWTTRSAPSAPEPNAMVLATANADGLPASRTVLCKGLDARGVVFFTNYTSAKSHDLTATRYASATFPWYSLHRQATVRGMVEKVSHGRDGDLLGEPPARLAARRVGVAAVHCGQWAPRAGERARQRPAPLRRRRRGAGAAALGRLAHPARGRRVLAGPPRPHARPAAVQAARDAWKVERLGPYARGLCPSRPVVFRSPAPVVRARLPEPVGSRCRTPVWCIVALPAGIVGCLRG